MMSLIKVTYYRVTCKHPLLTLDIVYRNVVASVQAQQMTMQAIAIQQQMMSSFPLTPASHSPPPSLRQVHGGYSSR